MNRYLLLIILLYSCNNSVKIDDKFSKNNTIENSVNISSKINPQSLSLEAKKITQKWSSLAELQSIINGLKSENYTAFMETDNYLKEFITELKKTLPKKRDLITEKSIVSYYNLIYQINKTIEKELQKITE